ncbi:MAG: hypothetical protein M3Y81_27335, partial [Chloroflexota bacterium]|nr:hypothetical protein [Chloroflexota bacterium]
ECTRFARFFAFSGVPKRGHKAGCFLTSGQKITVLSIAAIPVFRVHSKALYFPVRYLDNCLVIW